MSRARLAARVASAVRGILVSLRSLSLRWGGGVRAFRCAHALAGSLGRGPERFNCSRGSAPTPRGGQAPRRLALRARLSRLPARCGTDGLAVLIGNELMVCGQRSPPPRRLRRRVAAWRPLRYRGQRAGPTGTVYTFKLSFRPLEDGQRGRSTLLNFRSAPSGSIAHARGPAKVEKCRPSPSSARNPDDPGGANGDGLHF